jgi:hypothetical protein
MTNNRGFENQQPVTYGSNGNSESAGRNGLPIHNQEVCSEQEISRLLHKLSRAWQFSLDCDRSRWDFAVELSDLIHDGISHETLRWMIGKGLIEHAIESDTQQGIGRSFESSGGFTFHVRSCFVITAVGLELQEGTGTAVSMPPVVNPTNGKMVPSWDDQRHELRLAGQLVKRFKWRAANQEAVLAAFQEEGWPPRIDDPLSPVADTDPKRRLSDAIKCLNRKQKNPLLRFSGDGTGEGILWDVISCDTPSNGAQSNGAPFNGAPFNGAPSNGAPSNGRTNSSIPKS